MSYPQFDVSAKSTKICKSRMTSRFPWPERQYNGWTLLLLPVKKVTNLSCEILSFWVPNNANKNFKLQERFIKFSKPLPYVSMHLNEQCRWNNVHLLRFFRRKPPKNWRIWLLENNVYSLVCRAHLKGSASSMLSSAWKSWCEVVELWIVSFWALQCFFVYEQSIHILLTHFGT